MAEYIEREAFMHFLVKQHCENCDKRKGMKNGKERFIYAIGDAPCRSCGVDDALDYIEYFPSADVQPVVHGKWGKYSNTCSNCGISKYNFISFNFDDKNGYARPFGSWNYCPRCGARMDGEI